VPQLSLRAYNDPSANTLMQLFQLITSFRFQERPAAGLQHPPKQIAQGDLLTIYLQCLTDIITFRILPSSKRNRSIQVASLRLQVQMEVRTLAILLTKTLPTKLDASPSSFMVHGFTQGTISSTPTLPPPTMQWRDSRPTIIRVRGGFNARSVPFTCLSIVLTRD